MKDLYQAIENLRKELDRLNLDCNAIDVGIGTTWLRFTFIWNTGAGPRSVVSKITWAELDYSKIPEVLVRDLMENFSRHQQDSRQ